MSISNDTIRKAGPTPGNGVTTAFPFTFKVFAASDVLVVLTDLGNVETTQTLTTNYTVSLNVNQDTTPGGTVNMVVAPPIGYTLTIGSQLPKLQPTVLTNTGGFFPTVINDALDRVTILVQQLYEKLTRTLSLPFSAPSGTSTTLPLPAASKVIGWNSSASGLANYDVTTLATVAAYGTTNADSFSGDGVSTNFTLSANPGVINNMRVAVGGVVQRPGVDYTWPGGTTLSFTTAPPSGTSNILVQYSLALAQGTAVANAVTASDSASGTLWSDVQGFINKIISPTGDAVVGHTPSGAGAIATTVRQQLQNIQGFVINAKDAPYYVKGDNSTDDLAAINAMITAVTTGPVTVPTIWLPQGNYKVSGTILATLPVIIRGESAQSTVITTTSATLDVLNFSAGANTLTGCGVRDISFASTIAKTAGSYINFSATTGTHYKNTVENVTTDANAFYGVKVDSMYFSVFRRVYIGGVTSNGRGFTMQGQSASNKVIDIEMYDCRVLSGVAGGNTRGFHFGSYVAGIYAFALTAESSGLNYDFLIDDTVNVAGSKSIDFWFTQCISDTSTTTGWYLLSGQNVNLTDCWAASCINGPGVWIDTNMVDVEIKGIHSLANGQDGIVLNTCRTVRVLGGNITGNSALSSNSYAGINVKANTQDFIISDVQFGRYGATASHYADIYIATGTSDNYIVHDNKCNGFVTSAIVDGGTGTNAKVHDNGGYNPVGVAFPATPASGSPYTAGHAPETLYIIGGTVSAVATYGQTMFTTSNVAIPLGPNEQCTITYTVAPTLKTVKH